MNVYCFKFLGLGRVGYIVLVSCYIDLVLSFRFINDLFGLF